MAFDRAQFELFLDDMSARETADLIVEAAREEILYREALAMGLDGTITSFAAVWFRNSGTWRKASPAMPQA